MSERLPYEESLPGQLNDLPVPDEEQSWQDMKKLLEKDDDDRIVPPIFLRGCMGWMLLLLLFAGLWLVLRPDKWLFQKHGNPSTSQNTPSSRGRTGTPLPPTNHKEKINSRDDQLADTITSSTPVTTKNRIAPKEETPPVITAAPAKHNDIPSSSASRIAGRKHSATRNIYQSSTDQNNSSATPGKRTKGSKVLLSQSGQKPREKAIMGRTRKSTIDPVGNSPQAPVDPVSYPSTPQAQHPNLPAKNNPPSDTVKKQVKPVTPDSSASKPSPKQDEKKKKHYYLSAGIGLQQQIPIAGQTAFPYNYYGRKGSLADYIPSVYVRLHREEHWFIQGEFRYGAPQSVKEVPYSQHTTTDSSQLNHITNSLRLKKTFYHQLPLSFNYYVLPHWSIGTGVMYSRFFGAVSEQEINSTNLQTQRDSILLKKIVRVPASADSSFFTHSLVHILFQTEYSWRRLSLSLRYAKGLQPFIRYTDAAGILQKQTNQSFEAILRFRIWKQKR
jgi:hypothetical protein